jgi:formylglycine-generating enzyme required for sulfatase activity/serine/threonine protein kinase
VPGSVERCFWSELNPSRNSPLLSSGLRVTAGGSQSLDGVVVFMGDGGPAVDGRVGLPKGTLLDGSYRIERVIGSGGFGITYEAEDVKLGTKIAIKEYYPEEFGYRDASPSVRPKSEQHTKTFEWGRSRFLQEASTLARFRHPSVVQVTRVFEVFSTAYMVMVFEQGQSFEGWLKHLGRPPTQEELDRIAGPILDALEMMHGESFLHRDIAPDNIIVRADGTPVLLDFGAARRAVAEESRSLTGVVKSGYSPQEQYATDGRLQGPWTDIYAFGATLYRAVAGKVPEESTLRAIDDRMLSAVSVEDGKYRPGFLEAIDVCLEVHHADRPQSVAQVRSMLLTRPAREIPPPVQVVTAPVAKKSLEQDSAIIARLKPVSPDTKPTRVPPTRRSMKAWWAIYFASVIAVVSGVFGGLQYTRWQGAQEAKRVADVEAAKRKGEYIAKNAVEEREHREAEAKRFQEGARLAFEAAQRAERAEQQRREEEAKRKADTKAVMKVPVPFKFRDGVVTTTPPAQPPQPKPVPPTAAITPARCDGIEVTVGQNERRCFKPGAGMTEQFKDCPECPNMVVVPAGELMMGSPAIEPERSSLEEQVRVAIAAPFAVGKFAVTFDEWDACVVDGDCNRHLPGDNGWGRGNRPVININWDDAKAYAAWLSQKTGNSYRLLSEAEREYVTRAGTTTPFWWGTSITPKQANFDGHQTYAGGGSRGEFRQATAPVDSFEPNQWGLYNVHGNVWEWTEDCWNDTNTGNPGDGSARTSGDCSRRVVRGGSWASYPRSLRSAFRARSTTVDRNTYQGVRLARTLKSRGEHGAPTDQTKDATSRPDNSQTGQKDVIALASRRLEAGDVAGARELLAAAEDGSQGPVLFALAETYDPNMLAAWGTRGVAADVARARALYRKALSLGVASAHGRLTALAPKPNAVLAGPPISATVRGIIITLPPTISAKPSSQAALPIGVAPADAVPRNSFVRVRGLPPTAALTEGYSIALGSWAVSLAALPELKIMLPAGTSGRSEIIVTLVSIDGSVLAETKSMLAISPASGD